MPEANQPPHDAFVLQQFGQIENARSFFQAYLPGRVARAIDWESLQPASTRYVDAELHPRQADLVFTARWDGKELLLYLLFEHKSWPDFFTRFQLLESIVRIWGWHLRHELAEGPKPRQLPFILPLVLYHGEKDWTISKNFAGLVEVPAGLEEELGRLIPSFEHLLVDLHREEMKALRGSPPVQLGLGVLKGVSEEREWEWLKELFLPLLRAMKAGEARRIAAEMFTYLARASRRLDRSTFEAMAATIPAEQIQSDMMTLAEQLHKEGEAKGRQEGWQEGEQEGWRKGRQEGELEGWRKARRIGVLDVLEARFGEVPPAVRARLDGLNDEAELARAMRAASTISSLADFPRTLG